MLWSTIFTGLAAFVSLTNAVTIFSAPQSYTKPGVSYARAIVLDDGTFLVTFENYSGEPPYMPIFESKDQGATWKEKSRVFDTIDFWGMRYHPTLIQIPAALGQYPAGSIVFSGTAVPADGSKTKLHVFVSTDKAASWQYVSTIAEGGIAAEENGKTPVWHPFFFFFNGKLLCYFSDQRDAKHGSKIVYSDTSDLKTWSDPVNQVAYDDYNLRPTVAIVTQIGGNKYLMSYEFGGANPNYAVYYKISPNPYNFDSATGTILIDTKGEIPTGAPYAAYVGGGAQATDGTIIISSSDKMELFVNRKSDASGPWEIVYTDAPKAYSRCVVPLNAEQVLLVGAGPLGAGPNPQDRNSVDATIVSIKAGSTPGGKKSKRWIA
ncbi:BNR/Asp-box repeat domain-containing protein [Phyllosticta capitalensis]|uniref:BNR/Asp-box repeat domain-containing protein n=1 Tax=Phyllosticta capitalensis TaxID=121624 RepID=A0ABR1Z3X1_9PEZI